MRFDDMLVDELSDEEIAENLRQAGASGGAWLVAARRRLAGTPGSHTEVATMAHEPDVRDATVMLDGLSFHYRDWGDAAAPPVVLLHAYLQHARSWDTIAHGLADRFRVLALDQRGHGESAHAADYHEVRLVADLAGFADSLELERFAAVGFSIGGSVAASYAALCPDRVDRLVLLECFTGRGDPGDAPWLHTMRDHLTRLRGLPEPVASPQEAADGFRPLAPYAEETELRRWVGAGLKQGQDGRFSWRYDPGFRAPGPPGRLVPDMDVLRRRLAHVECPMLFLVGATSWMVEPTAHMATANPRTRTVTISNAGHWVPLDNPSDFLAAVRGFLTEAA